MYNNNKNVKNIFFDILPENKPDGRRTLQCMRDASAGPGLDERS